MHELIGLIQLASCDLTRRLLPKTLIHAVSAAVIVSDIPIAGVVATVGDAALFTVLFVMNLTSPRLIAFG